MSQRPTWKILKSIRWHGCLGKAPNGIRTKPPERKPVNHDALEESPERFFCHQKAPAEAGASQHRSHLNQSTDGTVGSSNPIPRMSSFDSNTPFMLLARIHVKPGCVEDYLELARATDAAVENSEPGMLHHTFDQDPDDPQAFVWSEVYANDAAFEAHVTNPPVQEYLQKHAELGDGFSVEVYGTVGSECQALMESFGLPLKIFKTKLGYSRVV